MTLAIYKFEVVEGQEWIFPTDDDDDASFFALDGRLITEWPAPAMKLDMAERTYSDFPWLGEHAPILKKPAVDALSPSPLLRGRRAP